MTDRHVLVTNASTTTTRYSKWPALNKQFQQYLGESPQRHQYAQPHSHNVHGIHQCRLQMQQHTAVLAATDVVRQAYGNINHTTPFAPNPITQRTKRPAALLMYLTPTPLLSILTWRATVAAMCLTLAAMETCCSEAYNNVMAINEADTLNFKWMNTMKGSKVSWQQALEHHKSQHYYQKEP